MISLSECIGYIHDELFSAKSSRVAKGQQPLLKVAKATVELNIVAMKSLEGKVSLGVRAFGFGADGQRRSEDSCVQRITLELEAVTKEDIGPRRDKLAPGSSLRIKVPTYREMTPRTHSSQEIGPAVLSYEPAMYEAVRLSRSARMLSKHGLKSNKPKAIVLPRRSRPTTR